MLLVHVLAIAIYSQLISYDKQRSASWKRLKNCNSTRGKLMKRSVICIGWNSITQPYNNTTGVTIRITQSLTSEKAQLVANNNTSIPLNNIVNNCTLSSSGIPSVQVMDRVGIIKDS